MQIAKSLDRKSLVRIGGGGLVMAVLGAAVALVTTGALASAGTAVEQVSLAYTYTGTERLPSVVNKASADGWHGSVRCLLGQGRYYQKPGPDRASPLMLIFNEVDKLVGIQVNDPRPQASLPWVHVEARATSVPGLESEHWRFGIYFINPVKACGVKARGVCPSCFT